MFLRILPVLLSAIILAAHYLRGGYPLFMLIYLLAPFLLLKKKAWAVRVVQALMWFGVIEWLITILLLIEERIALNQDYLRMVIILGAVTLLTAGSTFVFRAKTMRARYGLGKQPAVVEEKAAAQ